MMLEIATHRSLYQHCVSRIITRNGPAFRCMATIRPSIPHEQRTSAEPREQAIEPVTLSHIRQINDSIRLIRLTSLNPGHTIKFLPGQWLDVFIPGLSSAGGFTITSAPSQARSSNSVSVQGARTPGFLELAIQKSANPPAKWLWRPEDEILRAQLAVRVGGSFTWPPPKLDERGIERLVLVAGGVGINPLISIFSHLIRSGRRPREIHFIYATKADSDLDPHRILFLPRLMDLVAAAEDPNNVTLSLFASGIGDYGLIEHGQFPNRAFARRITKTDLTAALNGYKHDGGIHGFAREGTVCYVCGPPRMTDELVDFLSKQPGMSRDTVLCEKWW